MVFNGKAQVRHAATCRRSSPSPAGTCTRRDEIGIDDFQADRSPDARYRTTPLKGLCHAHEGRLLSRRPVRDAARRGRPLRRDAVARPDAAQKSDLVEYLKSLYSVARKRDRWRAAAVALATARARTVQKKTRAALPSANGRRRTEQVIVEAVFRCSPLLSWPGLCHGCPVEFLWTRRMALILLVFERLATFRTREEDQRHAASE